MSIPLGTPFKALSDPTRRKILDLLRTKDLSAGEIVDKFTIAGASISHHLSILKAAGLVQMERKGQQLIYSIDTTVFDDIIKWFNNFRKKETNK